tara:strand:- start:1761 stop:2252 length:492 start_codon:yes stop_codon:yes gene_type:complete
LYKLISFYLVFLLIFSGCQSGRSLDSSEKPEDAFTQSSFEEISLELKEQEDLKQSLQFESEWLKLRSQFIDAEKYARECRIAELKLAAEMARFGSLDQRLPGQGFITDVQRDRWNTQLETKKATRITAVARANLLLRDLKDLEDNINKAGYQVSQSQVFKKLD